MIQGAKPLASSQLMTPAHSSSKHDSTLAQLTDFPCNEGQERKNLCGPLQHEHRQEITQGHVLVALVAADQGMEWVCFPRRVRLEEPAWTIAA